MALAPSSCNSGHKLGAESCNNVVRHVAGPEWHQGYAAIDLQRLRDETAFLNSKETTEEKAGHHPTTQRRIATDSGPFEGPEIAACEHRKRSQPLSMDIWAFFTSLFLVAPHPLRDLCLDRKFPSRSLWVNTSD